MSTDFSIRPVGVPAPAPPIAPQTQAASNGVATELPASQSVTPADESTSARNDPSTLGDGDISDQTYFDRDAATLVFRLVNTWTGEVVEQYPDAPTVRSRAYIHALDLAKANQRRLPTDRDA